MGRYRHKRVIEDSRDVEETEHMREAQRLGRRR